MNYRKLTKEELIPLEKEFIDFLVVNGIVAEDWEHLKQAEPEKAEQMISLFSEVIFEGIFRKTRFLEIRTSQFIHAYQCLPEKIVLVGVESNHHEVDLTKYAELGSQLQEVGEGVSVLMTEKTYSKKREYELFEMVEKGCQISDGNLFKVLSLAYMDNKDHE